MDAVNAFNQELFALMDMKPPISRAKMILITKSAIKAIKLYKHVVQIVEKFIKKCRPEYKVPGLYVIDSIVRQSRHQFGIDKDVFGPRFTKNLTATFHCLYTCPSEDKSKIVRVLNLWQKNGVFRIEIIQPLLDMAAGAAAVDVMTDNSMMEEGSSPPSVMIPSELPDELQEPSPAAPVPQLPTPDAFAAVAQLFQSSQGQQLQQILQTFQQPPKPQSPVIDENVFAQVQAITSQLNAPAHQPERKTAFDKLLDRFDYDDEPDAAEESKKEASSPLLSAPQHSQPPLQPFTFPADNMQPAAYPSQLPGQVPNMDQFQPMMMGMQQEQLPQQTPLPPNGQMLGFGMVPSQPFTPMVPPMVSEPPAQGFRNTFQMQPNEMHVQKGHQQEMPMEVELPNIQENKRHMNEQSNSVSRSPKRRRSRSGSRSRRSRHRRSRSRSRDRRRHSPKSRSQERRDREKEKERRQKGLPPIKSETVSICSTTLWIGQLDKKTTQQDVGSFLEEFGPIESINMIPPRGCAYIVMLHRQDAYRALMKLSRGNVKVNQKAIKIAWALNKGIKSEYKQYWDVEIGVTYIPWNKVKPGQLEHFCEGGMLDNDTLCPEWKALAKKPEPKDVSQNGATEAKGLGEASTAPQVLPLLSISVRAPIPAMQVPPLQPMSAHQPVPSIPTPGVPAVQGLPPPQGLPPLQGVPPLQGMPLPQGLPPQGLPLPQGMPLHQGMPPHQPIPGMGPLQHPGFPIGIPPPGFAPGVPPPLFMRPGFNPMHMPPGFLPPPGLPPPMTPPVSIPLPTPGINIPTSTADTSSNDSSKDVSRANPKPMVPVRETKEEEVENADNGNGYKSTPSGGPNNAPGPLNPLHGDPQEGPEQGQAQGAHPGPPQGPFTGQPQGPRHGTTEGAHEGSHQGLPDGTDHSPPEGHHYTLPENPHHGPSEISHHGPPEGPHHNPSEGPHLGPQEGPRSGPPEGAHHGLPEGSHHGPQEGPNHGPPESQFHGPPEGLYHGPPEGPYHGPPEGPFHGPPQGPYHGPPQGPFHGPLQGHYQGPHHGPPQGPHHGPPQGPHHGPPQVPHHGPPQGPHHGPPQGPHHGPPQGPLHGPSQGPSSSPHPGPPSTGLLGARPGLIPLQRPPGVPSSNMQRFPMSQRPAPPHMMNRGPPPGQGGFGMPPHGMRGPLRPQGHFPRQRGPEGHGGPEERDGRQFRGERQGFPPGREAERFGRRSFGSRNEDDRERFGRRFDDPDHERPPNRGRSSWGRGSPSRERQRDSEERNRWSMGHERERSHPRGRGEFLENRKSDAELDEDHKPLSSRMRNAETVTERNESKAEPVAKTPTEEQPQTAKSSEEAERDVGSNPAKP
ncbi:SR-related and CTD-associated factor 4 isoform X2 [Xenopus laevis]|uniref:SR-related and CTD-associated factor 4 isoform X2 n=1 Tax=Xenopus laevis TaxID=8355 RepID=A0A8J0UDK5_XENLA|nr:SR-related and CTD-associated factor 4 isoform X2 [Xenopus laevis]